MVPEQTPREHRQQRDMVIRSLLLAPSRTDRSEEGLRGHVCWPAPPAPPPRVSGHSFVVPVVREL